MRYYGMDKKELSAYIKAKGIDVGYDLCGIISAEPFREYASFLNERIKRFPESTHLYESLCGLAYPEEKAGWAKTVIVCARRYNKYRIPEGVDKLFGKVYLFAGRLECSKERSN